MPDQTTLVQRVSTAFTQLTTVASDLNAVSDELGKSVAQIDFALKNLNLGITVWVKIRDWDYGEAEDYEHWSEHVGYAKLSGKWGISLKRVEGNHRNPERDSVEEWLFNDAPRTLRLEAIEKIPELLEQLSKQATIAAKKIREKLTDLKAVVGAVNPSKPMNNVTAKKGSSARAMSDVPLAHGVARAMVEDDRMNRAAIALAQASKPIEIPQSLIDGQEMAERAQEMMRMANTTPFGVDVDALSAVKK